MGDLRALALRPVLLQDDVLHVRIGLRWRTSIPLRSIRRLCPGPDPVNHPSCAIAAALGAPQLYLHLERPVELHGVLGLKRRGECLGLRVDDPVALCRAIERRRPDLAAPPRPSSRPS